MLQEKLCCNIIPFVATKVHMNIRKYVGIFLTLSRHYFYMPRHGIKKGTNPRSVVVATFNEGTIKQLAYK